MPSLPGLRAEHLPGEAVEGALEVGHRQALVDGDAVADTRRAASRFSRDPGQNTPFGDANTEFTLVERRGPRGSRENRTRERHRAAHHTATAHETLMSVLLVQELQRRVGRCC